ncbi:hypothetical protein [Alkalilimnicola ehrlichii]|uniref:Uncharacterized protein n=1 Tax=Alkalilimnicola ehrlichii TaxID=351052 RepID=A0A3E0WWS2_9GAMM|nr:hypothetical protein [Alkalilimnicola ehrlichii]RFA36456.1 hypothetical protein CAL65_10785 [Alkalilimnicola ehrlichii]
MSAGADNNDPLACAPQRALGDTAHLLDGHRELILPALGKTARLVLRLNDSRFGWLDIPFGRTRAQSREDIEQSREQAPGTRKDISVPILPLCYTTPERDAKQTALPKADGYLYIFVEGRLWRELRSVGRGFYKDVNLAELAGEDEREPTGEPDARILVPYRIDGEPVTVEMCYAHVQWSWERINSMGGLAEEHIGDTPPPMPTDEQLAEAEALRALRMRRLDLSGYAERFPERAPDEQCAGVRNITDVVHLHALKWLQRAQIPVVELDDHLGIVTKLAENYQTAWAEMGKLLEDLRNPEHEGEKANEFPFAPWFDSALLANRYFFADFRIRSWRALLSAPASRVI